MTVDRSAFPAAWDADAPDAYRAALAIVRDTTVAQAAVRDAFVRALGGADAAGDGAGTTSVHAPAGIAMVARRVAIETLRRQGRPATVAGDIADDAEPTSAASAGDAVWADPAQGAPAAGAVATAAACLATLAPDDVLLLTLRYAEGQGIDAVADLVGRPAGTTSAALHRARGRFTAAYADRVFSRPGLPGGCRAFRDQAITRAAMRPASAAYLAHADACTWCRESEQLLRERATACAAAPLLGLSPEIPSELRAATIAALAAAAPDAAAATSDDAAIPAADLVTAAAPAAPAAASPDPTVGPSRRGSARLAVAGVAVAAVVAGIGGAAWVVTHQDAGDGATSGGASAAGAGTSAAPSATPRPTLAAPPGFVAFDVVTCGTLGLDGSIDAGGSVVGVADLPSDVAAGLDPTAFSLYAVPSGQGSAAPELYLAPRYWTCIHLANEAGDYRQVSLMPTLPVLLEKLGQAPITATEPGGTFVCGAPLDAAACRAARALHERPSLATMR